MLVQLAIRDIVLIDRLELGFREGLSVLTGETGAGKSILLDALQLLLGGRGDAAVVREGAARAELSAEFDLPAVLKPWLEEAGFDEQDSLLLRRVIDAQGGTRLDPDYVLTSDEFDELGRLLVKFVKMVDASPEHPLATFAGVSFAASA